MSALVVYESHFGNNAVLARTIAAELCGDAIAARDAPFVLSDDIDLVVAGGPTHALALSSAATRAAARAAGGEPGAAGLRDWLRAVALTERHRVAVFGTATSALSGSAARAAKRLLIRRKVRVVDVAEFVVLAQTGPLAPGELERASAWAISLRA